MDSTKKNLVRLLLHSAVSLRCYRIAFLANEECAVEEEEGIAGRGTDRFFFSFYLIIVMQRIYFCNESIATTVLEQHGRRRIVIKFTRVAKSNVEFL